MHGIGWVLVTGDMFWKHMEYLKGEMNHSFLAEAE